MHAQWTKRSCLTHAPPCKTSIANLHEVARLQMWVNQELDAALKMLSPCLKPFCWQMGSLQVRTVHKYSGLYSTCTVQQEYSMVLSNFGIDVATSAFAWA